MRRLEREVVVDSSVLVKFFVEEPDSGKADALFRHCEAGFIRFVCPDLVFPECVNVLWKKVQGSELSEPEAEERISKLLALLVTADAKFYRKIKPKHPRILLLSELRP